jgi:hypothetical protein
MRIYSLVWLILKGVGETAKKKFTFKPVLLYIEDNLLFDSNYDHVKRIEFIKNIQKTMEYSNFKIYFSLLENVIF